MLRLSSVLALTLALSARAVWAADHLAEVRALYASAAYEDSLALLAKVDDPVQQDVADEYRALCLLALNREAAAEEAVAAWVRRRPQVPDDLAKRPSKLVALYKKVRARLLPGLATSAYTAAKTTFEAGDFAASTRQFREALVLLRAADHERDETAPATDYETLATGFLSLAESRLAEARKAAVPKEPEVRVQPASLPSSLLAATAEAPPAARSTPATTQVARPPAGGPCPQRPKPM